MTVAMNMPVLACHGETWKCDLWLNVLGFNPPMFRTTTLGAADGATPALIGATAPLARIGAAAADRAVAAANLARENDIVLFRNKRCACLHVSRLPLKRDETHLL
mmetsp:Transcript_93/g.175  ORF Transcript_93/g.175 Transcript_93/m.175 type:complete len:105 (-) Transcript_93:45-359(-)